MTISFKSAAAVIHEQPSSRSSTTAAFILGLSLALFAPMVLGNWNTVDLMSNRFYRLHWRLQGQQRLHFRVEAKSRGYFALGVSKTGTMNSADIVTGYIHPNGSAILLVSKNGFSDMFDQNSNILYQNCIFDHRIVIQKVKKCPKLTLHKTGN